MEVKNGSSFKKAVLFAEFLGTCGLILSVNMSNSTTHISIACFVMIVLFGGISGGHINPAVTIGVYIERKEYAKNIWFAIMIMLAQFAGAVFALVIGYMLRVTVITSSGIESFSPRVNTFAPPILISTDGKPSYGQVMLGETIATFVFVMMVLTMKKAINDKAPAIVCLLAIGITFQMCVEMFSEVSGGVFNPAIALSLILWNAFAGQMDPTFVAAQLPASYATCYLFAPVVGAVVAGTTFNYLAQIQEEMADHEDDESEELDDLKNS